LTFDEPYFTQFRKYIFQFPTKQIHPYLFDLSLKKHNSFLKSEEIRNIGFQFYKKKNDIEAINKFELSLQILPLSKTYFNYANSLSNLNEMDNSIKAYEMSLLMGNSEQANLFYNMACAFSRKKDLPQAKIFLEFSIRYGYSSINYISSDSDLLTLKKDKEWQYVLKKISRLNNTRDSLNGKNIIRWQTYNTYEFEKEKVTLSLGWSEIKNHKKTGTYCIKGETVSIFFDKETGEKNAENKNQKYAVFTKNISESETLNIDEIYKGYRLWVSNNTIFFTPEWFIDFSVPESE